VASFSITNAIFIQPLPISEPERFVRVYRHQEGSSAQYFPISADELREMRGMRHVFDGVAAEQPRPLIVGAAGSYERIWGEAVSDGYFELLGVAPVVGRAFTPREDETGDAVVVLSHELWTRQFGGDPQVLTRELRIDGRPHRIIGVAPARFRGTLLSFTSELWIPCRAVASRPGHNDDCNGFSVAKLRPGMALGHARGALGELAHRLERELPATNRGSRFAAFYEAQGRVPPPFHDGVLGFSAESAQRA
jgi:putative ABC transport system permease protein